MENGASRRWGAATVALVVVLATVLGLVGPAGAAGAAEVPPPAPRPVHPEPRIVGGTKAPAGAWPTQVALIDRNRGDGSAFAGQFCGGTIVDRSWILTAAHCLRIPGEWQPTPGQVDVLIGTQRLDAGGTRIRAAEFRLHPGWDADEIVNDIALVRLDRPVPAPVAVQALGGAGDSGADQWATAVGWGAMSGDGTRYPTELRQVELYVGTDSECGLGGDRLLAATQVCAWDDARSTCAGDSGGPLLVPVGGTWVQIGITSYGGRPCEDYGSYFTQVSAFTTWIRPQIRYGPHSDATALVGTTYRDLFGRAPTGTELFSAVADLNGGRDPAEYVAGLLDGTTYRTRAGGVTRLYRAIFLRAPDTAGLGHWMGEINRGVSFKRIAEKMVRQPEFGRRYGTVDDGGFVDLVYANVLRRVPSAQDRAYWVDQLTSGKRTRGQVMVGFSESSEHRRATAVEVRLTGAFWGLVRRAPSAGEIDRWWSASVVEIARFLLTSASYAGRF